MTPLEFALLMQLGTLCGRVYNDHELDLRLQISCINSKHREIRPGRWPWSVERLDPGHHYTIDWSKRRT